VSSPVCRHDNIDQRGDNLEGRVLGGRARIPLMPREVIFYWLETMIVRCIDSLFQTDVLVEGWEYEVRAERDDCYILSGFDKGFSKTRFEIVSHPSNARDRGN
jgi:hypothetical protein